MVDSQVVKFDNMILECFVYNAAQAGSSILVFSVAPHVLCIVSLIPNLYCERRTLVFFNHYYFDFSDIDQKIKEK